MTSESDKAWKLAKVMHGWETPAPASLFWRLPVIRHVRAAWHASRVARHDTMWRALGSIPTGYDDWVLYAVRRGWC